MFTCTHAVVRLTATGGIDSNLAATCIDIFNETRSVTSVVNYHASLKLKHYYEDSNGVKRVGNIWKYELTKAQRFIDLEPM